MDFSRILIAIEGPPLAYKVMNIGYNLYKVFKPKIAIVHCIDIPYALRGMETGIIPPEIEDLEIDNTNEMMDEVISKYKFNKKDIEKFIPKGVPQEEVIKISHEWKPDLMILGTHSRTGISKFFLGSVKEKIVQKANIPILIVPIDS